MYRLSLLAVFATLGSACSAFVDFDECERDEECPSGFRCADRACTRAAAADRVVVSGDIEVDTTWDAAHIWEVSGTVFVDAGVTLTLGAGTRVELTDGATIVVDRGGRIDAVGTERQPVVLTSSRPEGQRGAGDWGGLILLGSAPTSEGEDLTYTALESFGRSSFGGPDRASTCGVLEYVRIEFGGVSKDAGREVPALALAGCGNQTKIAHVQVHRARDEAVEITGGEVALSHILVTYAGEVALEYKKGWAGVVQFLMITRAPRGLTASSPRRAAWPPTRRRASARTSPTSRSSPSRSRAGRSASSSKKERAASSTTGSSAARRSTRSRSPRATRTRARTPSRRSTPVSSS